MDRDAIRERLLAELFALNSCQHKNWDWGPQIRPVSAACGIEVDSTPEQQAAFRVALRGVMAERKYSKYLALERIDRLIDSIFSFHGRQPPAPAPMTVEYRYAPESHRT